MVAFFHTHIHNGSRKTLYGLGKGNFRLLRSDGLQEGTGYRISPSFHSMCIILFLWCKETRAQHTNRRIFLSPFCFVSPEGRFLLLLLLLPIQEKEKKNARAQTFSASDRKY